jgi:HK97 family phage portal protein
MSILDGMKQGALEALTSLARRAGIEGDVADEQMESMLVKAGVIADPTDEKPRGMYHDPYAIVDWGGWRERPSSITYETLRQMSMQNQVIGSIIQLRTWQISQFAKPQQDEYDKGYRIILRNRRDKKKAMTTAEQKRADEIEKMLETTGILQNGQKPSQRDSFRTFLKKSVHDILVYDQWCFEKIRDRAGRVSQILALPSETIRPAVIDHEHMDPTEAQSRVSHVQVYEDTVVTEFSPEDIAFCVMNPRSDLRVNGFGLSPIEKLIRLVTAWLFGFEYNQRFFSQGSAIKGILNIKGAIPDKQLRAFRRMWYAQVSGVTNAWRTPILNSEDIQWQSMHSTNREMEYAAWMDWLTKLICAMYGVDPIEINFQYGNTGSKSSLNEGSQADKIVESKDKGLRPLMEHIEDQINAHVIWELEPDFEFDFTGLSGEDDEKAQKARIAAVGSYKMVDEARAEEGLDPMPDNLGQMINNPTWLQFAQAQQAQQQGVGPDGQPVPGQPGAFGEPGDDDPSPEGMGEDEPLLEPGQEAPDDDGEDKTPEAFKSLLRIGDDDPLVKAIDDVHASLRGAKITRSRRGKSMLIDIDLGED